MKTNESLGPIEDIKYKEISDEDIQGVLTLLRQSYREIEGLRQKYSLAEPHGAIDPDRKVRWFSKPEDYTARKVNYRPSKKARRHLAEKGWVFFHCHPDSLENITDCASTNDRAGTAYHIYEAIFHHKGITLLVATRIYPLEKTEEIIAELRDISPNYADLYGDENWAFDALVSEKFAIKTIDIPKTSL